MCSSSSFAHLPSAVRAELLVQPCSLQHLPSRIKSDAYADMDTDDEDETSAKDGSLPRHRGIDGHKRCFRAKCCFVGETAIYLPFERSFSHVSLGIFLLGSSRMMMLTSIPMTKMRRARRTLCFPTGAMVRYWDELCFHA